jgi:hypothetical protein
MTIRALASRLSRLESKVPTGRPDLRREGWAFGARSWADMMRAICEAEDAGDTFPEADPDAPDTEMGISRRDGSVWTRDLPEGGNDSEEPWRELP